jgi:hypothetical protein
MGPEESSVSREDLIVKLREASDSIVRFLRRDLMRGGRVDPRVRQSLEQLLVTLQGARYYLAPDGPRREGEGAGEGAPRSWDQSATMKVRMDDD